MDTDPQSIIIKSVVLLALLILSGFFSSAETALISVNKIQLQLLSEDKDKRAARVLWILERPGKMLSAILVCNNVVNLSASALTTVLTSEVFGNKYVGLATGILTFLVLIFGEVTPKSMASARSLKFSLCYSAPIKAFMIVLTPVIFVIDAIRLGLLKLFKINPDEKEEPMTEDELKELVDVAMEEEAIEADEFEMIHNVFSLDEVLAKDIMVPRRDIESVDLSSDLSDVMRIFRENTYTRYPVFADDHETVVGTINVKDLLLMSETERTAEDFNIGKIMREPHFTFEHIEVGTLLLKMRKENINIMIVLDEYGGVSGLVTMEDILEEIVGEIHDEYDEDEFDEIAELKEGKEFLVDGAVSLDEVNEILDLPKDEELASDEYDTIGGFMIEYLDRLPKSGEAITLKGGLKLIAEIVRKNRIEKVHIILP